MKLTLAITALLAFSVRLNGANSSIDAVGTVAVEEDILRQELRLWDEEAESWTREETGGTKRFERFLKKGSFDGGSGDGGSGDGGSGDGGGRGGKKGTDAPITPAPITAAPITPAPVVPEGFRRELGEIEDPSPQRIRELMEENGADPNGTFNRRDGLISKEACDRVKAFMDATYASDESIDPNEVHPENLPRFAHYNIYISAHKLIEMIGMESTRGILEFYHEALGYEAPVTKIKLQLSWNREAHQHFTYHIDRKSSMIVFLGPNEDQKPFRGGSLSYLGLDGPESTGEILPGTAIAHGPDVLHGARSWIGKRYIVDIMSKDDSMDCMLKDHVTMDVMA